MRIITWMERPQRNGTNSSVSGLKLEYAKQRQAAVPNTLLKGGGFTSLAMLFSEVLLSFMESFWGIL